MSATDDPKACPKCGEPMEHGEITTPDGRAIYAGALLDRRKRTAWVCACGHTIETTPEPRERSDDE